MDNSTKEAWTGGKNLSSEATEKRRSINKKIFKFGCFPILILIGISTIFGILFDDSANNKSDSKESQEINDPLKLGMDSVKGLVGNSVPYDMWEQWGSSEALEGTNNQLWVAYLDSANISFVSDKSSDNILFACFGKESALEYMEKRKEKVKNQFSDLYGNHPGLTELIKRNMNDPDSYEHVETRFRDEGEYIFVITKFRGKNAFGGTVTNTISAKVDFDGDVIEIISKN